MNPLAFIHLKGRKCNFEKPEANMNKIHNQLTLLDTTDIVTHERDILT